MSKSAKHTSGPLEIKGAISIQESSISFTCCDSRPNIHIGGVELHAWLKEKGGLSGLAGEDDADQNNAAVQWNVRYVVRSKPFSDSESFEDVAAAAQVGILSSSEVHGCYSEWTCGVGDYDFVINGPHSIFNELENEGGKNVWIRFTDEVRS